MKLHLMGLMFISKSVVVLFVSLFVFFSFFGWVYYSIDCINYFFHREMNLKNRIAHFMKAEGNVCLFGVIRPTREFFTHLETSVEHVFFDWSFTDTG